MQDVKCFCIDPTSCCDMDSKLMPYLYVLSALQSNFRNPIVLDFQTKTFKKKKNANTHLA